ncbi:hypothetical protein L6452_19573 [Arctium lappa]|uniref:Uncharacterized protein n=1 Tax=Arctium lappa TaxID=4217 RepID=A0ACB9B9C8_ARCLA|nr:hypothetical protein L6452_19573 [Arctium lappa]
MLQKSTTPFPFHDQFTFQYSCSHSRVCTRRKTLQLRQLFSGNSNIINKFMCFHFSLIPAPEQHWMTMPETGPEEYGPHVTCPLALAWNSWIERTTLTTTLAMKVGRDPCLDQHWIGHVGLGARSRS